MTFLKRFVNFRLTFKEFCKNIDIQGDTQSTGADAREVIERMNKKVFPYYFAIMTINHELITNKDPRIRGHSCDSARTNGSTITVAMRPARH